MGKASRKKSGSAPAPKGGDRREASASIRPRRPGPTSFIRSARLPILLIVVTAAVYAPCLRNGFTNWDDPEMLLDNAAVRHLSWENVGLIFTSDVMGHYHPLTSLSLAVEHHFFGLNPLPYHLDNVLLHLLNTLLAFWLCRRLSGSSALAFLAALLFGLHPIHVEAAAWVTARKDVLFAFFFLAASLAYLSFKEKGGGRWYALALGLFVGSLLSKAMAVSLPVALLLYDYVERRVFDRRAIVEKIPFFLLAAAAGVVALRTQDPLAKAILGSGWSVSIAVGFASYCLVFYLVQLAWPVKLAAVYSFPRLAGGAPPPAYWLALAVLLLAGTWLAWFHRRNRRVVFGVLFFLAAYAPVSQLVPFGQPIADRYLYLPALGLFFALAEGARWMWEERLRDRPRWRPYLVAGLLAVLAPLGWLAFQRCQVWENSQTLWDDNIRVDPAAGLAWNNRGMERSARGDLPGAQGDFARAVTLDPGNASIWNNLGTYRFIQGDLQGARSFFDRAVELNPAFVAALRNRGHLSGREGRDAEAIRDLSRVVALEPANPTAWLTRGIIRERTGDRPGAVSDFDRALTLNPELASGYLYRGVARAHGGRPDLALADYSEALRLQPDNAAAYFQRGLLRSDLDDAEGAIRDLREAIRLDPENAGLYLSLARLLQRAGRREEAERVFQQAGSLVGK